MKLEPLHHILCELEISPQPQNQYWPWDIAHLEQLGLVTTYLKGNQRIAMVALNPGYRINNRKPDKPELVEIETIDALVGHKGSTIRAQYKENRRKKYRNSLLAA